MEMVHQPKELEGIWKIRLPISWAISWVLNQSQGTAPVLKTPDSVISFVGIKT